MSIKKFKKLSRVLESVFKCMSLLLGIGAIGLLVGGIVSLFGSDTVKVTKSVVEMTGVDAFGVHLFTAMSGDLSEKSKFMALVISGLVLRTAQSYICWQAGIFFSILRTSKQPFSMTVYKLLKKIGLLLIISDIVSPLIYYLVVTLLMTDGYQIALITVTSQFLIGLVIYYMAEVIRYGVTLQKFTNDVV